MSKNNPERRLLISRANVAAAVRGDVDAVWERLRQAGAIEAFIPPAIGDYWSGQGGVYAGLVRGSGGDPDYHLILADAKPPRRVDWASAGRWTKAVKFDGCADFALPTRRESSLLFTNVGDRFDRSWYWTSESYSDSFAWFQGFTSGVQDYNHKDDEGLAVAVRRFKA